jgi:hypothetical protein
LQTIQIGSILLAKRIQIRGEGKIPGWGVCLAHAMGAGEMWAWLACVTNLPHGTGGKSVCALALALAIIQPSTNQVSAMNIAVLNQVPKGEQLSQAVVELEQLERARQVKAQIQRGLDASNDPAAPRTAHADFMAELKAELMDKINARQVSDRVA